MTYITFGFDYMLRHHNFVVTTGCCWHMGEAQRKVMLQANGSKKGEWKNARHTCFLKIFP
jgi:hypothetical protein